MSTSVINVHERVALLGLVNKIHSIGLMHGDLAERNVLNNNGRPVIIDLEDMKPHSCMRRMIVRAGAIQPVDTDFNCDEIYRLANDMKIWSPRESFCVRLPTFLYLPDIVHSRSYYFRRFSYIEIFYRFSRVH